MASLLQVPSIPLLLMEEEAMESTAKTINRLQEPECDMTITKWVSECEKRQEEYRVPEAVMTHI